MVPNPVAYVSYVQPLTGVTDLPYCELRARIASTEIKYLAYEKPYFLGPVAFWGVKDGAYC
jgi:hypothetical protein